MADAIEGVVYRAESYLAVGQVDRADTLLRDELAQRPDEPALLLTLAKVFLARRQWPEVVQTATAALESNPDSLNARMMIAWAAYQVGDLARMKQHLDVVLTHRPDHPTALMYLALHGERDHSTAGKKRTREIYRSALERSGGDPWYLLMAAKIEVRLADSAEARRLVDAGLAENPTDVDLLQMKAGLATTSIEESMGIVSGLLASSPADPALRARYDALVAARRRAVLTMLWLAPALVALAVAFLGGPFRTGALVAIGAASFTVWGIRNASIQALPAGYQAELASRAPWRVAVRIGGRAAAALTILGGVLLALGVVFGAWLLVLAAVGWAVARVASVGHERRRAASADADLAVLQPGIVATDGALPSVGPATRTVRRLRRRHAATMPLLLVPLCVVGLIPAGAFDETQAARAAVGMIAAIVGLTVVAGVLPWLREPGRPSATIWRLVRLAVPVVLLALVFLVGLANLVWVTDGWVNERPQWVVEEPTTPPTISPDYLDELESPGPIPTFTIPEFDIPSIPPLEPEG